MTIAIPAGTVIAAVDGSVDSRRAARWAAEQAHLERRPLTLVHATGVRPAPSLTHRSAVLLQEAAALAEEAHPDLTITSLSVPGEPREVLVDASATAHLLVVGSRGRGTVLSKVLGSVSAEVAKHAVCPVVVTRPTPPGAVKDGVVVGADGTPESVRVIEFAFRLASLRRLPLTVMHCVYDPVAAVVGARGPVHDHPAADELGLLVAESVAGMRERYPDVHVTTQLTRGLVENCLGAGPRPWDLVVVGRHPAHLLRSSPSTGVLERSHSVVAVVPVPAPVPA
jgi:nucleotide-binding universal stress UspA family protein